MTEQQAEQQAVASHKIAVKYIEILGAEGLIVDSERFPRTYRRADSWQKASDALTPTWLSAPRGGAYHKVWFLIKWTDGQSYSGRVDVKRGEPRPNIARHVREFVAFRCGDARPAHLDGVTYADLIRRKDDADAWRNLRDNYDLGGD